VAGAATLVAGCFGSPDDGGSGDSDPGTDTTGATTTTSDDVLYQNEWTGVRIDKGSGWIQALPEGEARTISYTVNNDGPTGYDVYVFDRENAKETYEDWTNAPSNMKFETTGTVGLSGVTRRNVSGRVERTAQVPEGPLWIVVDHSDFDGGSPRAEVDGDSPESITVDVSVRLTPFL
jgi:hypothetical protein